MVRLRYGTKVMMSQQHGIGKTGISQRCKHLLEFQSIRGTQEEALREEWVAQPNANDNMRVGESNCVCVLVAQFSIDRLVHGQRRSFHTISYLILSLYCRTVSPPTAICK